MLKSWLLTTAAICLLSAPALAAFEWIPPSQPAAGANNYRAAPMASPSGFEANLVPMPSKEPLSAMPSPDMGASWNDKRIASPAPTPTANAASWNNTIPDPMAAPKPAPAPAPMPAPVAKAPTDHIEGFGRDVPLTIATRQIVPNSYVVQYGQNVNPDTVVTWSGGRSWKDALQDSLTERGMKATIVGDTVLIESAAPIAMPAPTPPVQEMQATSAPTPLMPLNEVTIPSAADSTMTAMAVPNTTSLQPVSITDAGPAMPAAQVWTAPRASTLRQVLTDWCRQANVQLQWSAQYDYPLMSDVQIGGSFEHAVETLLSGLVDAQPRPRARLHPNDPTGPAILVVETRYILE